MDQQTVVAIMYDFDRTLTTKEMQEYTFIPGLGMTASDFWKKANLLARTERMDSILAYMKLMLDESASRHRPIRRSDFVALGQDLEFFPGVPQWFDAVRSLGRSLGVEIRHYIISSGLREIIEGSAIGDCFERIYACEYLYDENGVAVWPRLAVNYTAKTQFLFRINKGVPEVYEDKELNTYRDDDERPIPFRNMIYIGDGLTDVPCMKLVKNNGGKSIAVHAPGDSALCDKLMRDHRIDFHATADYGKDGSLYCLITTILEKMRADDILFRLHRKQMEEAR